MKEAYKGSDHLIKNLERISEENSIFSNKSGMNAFLSLDQGNISEWFKIILPNTRIIIEPKIIGSAISIQYINGKLEKSINEYCEDITESIKNLKNIPKFLPIQNRIEIGGVLYDAKNKSTKDNRNEFSNINNSKTQLNSTRFCAFQIFHCNINHFESLQELKHLDFEIPQTQSTKIISEIEIYLQCWKEGTLFKRYPTSGLVLKINSRKFQKYLEVNNLSIHWAYSIK